MHLDRRIVWLLRVLLAILIVGLLVGAIGWADFELALSQANWHWLAPVYVTAAATILVNASLLRFLLTTGGLSIRLRRVLLAKTLGAFYSLILPGDLMAGVAKWADLSAATGDKAGVLSAMVLTKVALAVPPLLIGSVALLTSNPLPTDSLTVAAAATAVVVISATALLLNPATGRRLNNAMVSILRYGPGFLRSPGERIVSSLAGFQKLRWTEYITVLSLSFAVFGLNILGMSFAATAAGVSVPVTALFWINLILFITRLLPVTIGNLGIREGVLVLTFGLYGIDAAPAVLVGLLMFSSVLFVGFLGGVYQLAIASGWVAWHLREEDR
jgi:hypothetical protein